MRKLKIIEHISLDGVIQHSGEDGFPYADWTAPYRSPAGRDAILAAHGSYCIFLDGDCIVRPDFVGTHRRLAEPGWFVTGNRVLLSPALTTSVLRESRTPETWGAGRWIGERSRGGVNRLLALLTLPLGVLR